VSLPRRGRGRTSDKSSVGLNRPQKCMCRSGKLGARNTRRKRLSYVVDIVLAPEGMIVLKMETSPRMPLLGLMASCDELESGCMGLAWTRDLGKIVLDNITRMCHCSINIATSPVDLDQKDAVDWRHFPCGTRSMIRRYLGSGPKDLQGR
jgi:hypothetical protein